MAKIGSWKLRSVKNLLVHMPKRVVEALQSMYQQWGWEKSPLNEDLLRQPIWKAGYRCAAAGGWVAIYTMSEAALERLVSRMRSEWDRQLPSLADLSLRDIASKKPGRVTVDDPDYQSMTVAQVYMLHALVFEHWLLPRVREAYGDKGVDVLEAAWAKGSSDVSFVGDLDTVVKLREQSASLDVLKVSTLTHIQKLLGGTTPPSPDEKLAGAHQTLNKWEIYRKRYQSDQECFQAACAQRRADVDAQLLHDLGESRKVAKAGVKAVQEYKTHFLAIHTAADSIATSPEKTHAFIEEVATLEDATTRNVPVVIVWDLNGLTCAQVSKPDVNLVPYVDAFKAILAWKPQYTIGVVIHRRTGPSSKLSRRAFHNIVVSLLEKSGINCDLDLALNFKPAPRQKTPLIVPCYITFLGEQRDSIFQGSELLRGSITDLSAATYNQMQTGVSGDADRTGNNISTNSRLHYLPPETFERILHATFDNIRESTTKGGVVLNRRGQPMVAAVLMEPYSAAAVEAHLTVQLQQQTSGTFDLRSLVFVAVGDGRTLEDYVDDTVTSAWFAEKLQIEGHPRIRTRQFVGTGALHKRNYIRSCCRLHFWYVSLSDRAVLLPSPQANPW